MPDLAVVAFADAATAFDVRAELARLQKEYLIEMDDIVVVTRDEHSGAVALHQAVNLAAAGAVNGGLWGALIGLVFLSPLLGAATGPAAGALAGNATDIGIDDGFLRDVGQSLDKGGSAVCVLIRKMTADKVMQRLAPFAAKGRVVQTSFTQEQEARLRALVEAQVTPMPAGANQMGLPTG